LKFASWLPEAKSLASTVTVQPPVGQLVAVCAGAVAVWTATGARPAATTARTATTTRLAERLDVCLLREPDVAWSSSCRMPASPLS
jgi:hypothetical protein